MLNDSILRDRYPFSALNSPANLVIFPDLSAGKHRYRLLASLGGRDGHRPILVGMQRPVHVLEQGADVEEIVNMTAAAVIDAQERRDTIESQGALARG